MAAPAQILANTSIMELQEEIWEGICGHLDGKHCCHLASTSRHFDAIFRCDAPWKASLNHMVDACGADTGKTHNRELVRLVHRAFYETTGARYDLPTLAPRVVFCAEGVSSIDRAAEGPSKVLFESPCANLAHDVTPQTQWKMAGCCPCFTGMSCYWSSAATQNPDSDEWILLRLKAPVCLVTEMEISPYKAWWQPPNEQGNLPVYSPKQVQYEFGSFWGDVTLPNGQTHANSARFEGSGHAGEMLHVASARTAVPHSSRGAVTRLARPILALGGHCKVRMSGKVQRQTVSQSDDLYTCIQNIRIGGAPVRGAVSLVDVTGRWTVSAGLSCHECGSFEGGKGHFEAKRLVACVNCRQAHYCCAAHRSEDSWHKDVECPLVKPVIPGDCRQ